MRVADLFSGIGSFHHAATSHGLECVVACDIDEHTRKVYEANYGLKPLGDITKLSIETDIPDHDILCGGFPCQPFSQIGQRHGTDEARGRLIDYIVQVLVQKRPKACILENVKGLLNINGGDDFRRIVEALADAGYSVRHKVLRADDFGIPQMRQRLFIVCIRSDMTDAAARFTFPTPISPRVTLAQYMNMPFKKQCAYTIRCGGRNSGIDDRRNWDSYLLDDNRVYTLTIQDCMKLQGFDATTWDWANVSDTRRLKMLGNTIPTCLSKAILGSVVRALETPDSNTSDLINAMGSLTV
jgi:DNA (cytosine-5)-methyltransferase 1